MRLGIYSSRVPRIQGSTQHPYNLLIFYQKENDTSSGCVFWPVFRIRFTRSYSIDTSNSVLEQAINESNSSGLVQFAGTSGPNLIATSYAIMVYEGNKGIPYFIKKDVESLGRSNHNNFPPRTLTWLSPSAPSNP